MNELQKSDFFKNYNGLILLNKPPGLTSFDVLRILKNNFFLTK